MSGSTFEFQLGEQKYVATINTTLDYTISGSNVAIGTKNYSLSEALELLVEDSTFHISGPEKDRISVVLKRMVQTSGFLLQQRMVC